MSVDELMRKYQRRALGDIARIPAPVLMGIYVIHFKGDPSLFKIGLSRNLDQRLSNHHQQGASAMIVDHLIECSNYREVESCLHRMFANKRKYSEWFALSSDDLAFICQLRTGSVLTTEGELLQEPDNRPWSTEYAEATNSLGRAIATSEYLLDNREILSDTTNALEDAVAAMYRAIDRLREDRQYNARFSSRQSAQIIPPLINIAIVLNADEAQR